MGVEEQPFHICHNSFLPLASPTCQLWRLGAHGLPFPKSNLLRATFLASVTFCAYKWKACVILILEFFCFVAVKLASLRHRHNMRPNGAAAHVERAQRGRVVIV